MIVIERWRCHHYYLSAGYHVLLAMNRLCEYKFFVCMYVFNLHILFIFLNRFPCVLPDYDVITISISRSCLYYDECSHRFLFSFRILGDRSIRSMFSNTLSTSKSIYIFFVCFKICCCRHFGALKGWHTKITQSYQNTEQ